MNIHKYGYKYRQIKINLPLTPFPLHWLSKKKILHMRHVQKYDYDYDTTTYYMYEEVHLI